MWRTARSSASIPIDLDESDARRLDHRGPRPATSRLRGAPRCRRMRSAQKSMVYSPKRILTRMKRVDFDPKGERNVQNRGVSGYEPISWDEALDIVCDEIVRLQARGGPGGHPDHPRLAPPVGQRGLPAQHLFPLHEPHRVHLRRAQPGQLGRLALGRHAHVGQSATAWASPSSTTCWKTPSSTPRWSSSGRPTPRRPAAASTPLSRARRAASG